MGARGSESQLLTVSIKRRVFAMPAGPCELGFYEDPFRVNWYQPIVKRGEILRWLLGCIT